MFTEMICLSIAPTKKKEGRGGEGGLGGKQTGSLLPPCSLLHLKGVTSRTFFLILIPFALLTLIEQHVLALTCITKFFLIHGDCALSQISEENKTSALGVWS